MHHPVTPSPLRHILIGVIAALLAVLEVPRGASPPNVVLITLDTTRADRMGFLGSTRGLTPSLDALARESVVYSRAFSQAPVTTVSHATILTGTYPPFHGVADFGVPLRASVPYLPDLLHHQGYRTAAFVGSLILDPRSGTAPGFDRGFDTYDAGYRLRRPGENRYPTLERRGDDVVARALAWLDANRAAPFFLWVHLYDAHDPYDPPGDLKKRFAAAPYDGEIAAVDRATGHLIETLRSRDLLSHTVLVVAADHGEALGSHGEDTHGVFLYDETLHVPLLVRAPGAPAPARVDARVRLADVAPTILELAGLPRATEMQGQSLMPLVSQKANTDRPSYAETQYPRRAFGWSPLVSWRADRFLYVRAPTRELYDTTADPGETANIADRRDRVVSGIDAELEAFVKRVAGGSAGATAKTAAVDPSVAERLSALGYVSGSGDTARVSGVDPKDRIATANALHNAVVLVEDGAFDKAIPLLEKAVSTDPDIFMAQLQLGVARARRRQYALAMDPLRKAIALQPDVMMSHYELGVAEYESGDLKAAATEFETVATRMPKWADARYSLGSVYARIDRVPDGVRELRAALDLEPRHFRANLLLGRIETLQGDVTAAVPHLERAVDVQPSSAEAHQFLGDAYDRAGRGADAVRERQRAESLKK